MIFIKYISFFFHFLFIISAVFLTAVIQNSLWPVSFSISWPLQLWIPLIIYWSLYQSPPKALFCIYLTSWLISGASTTPVSSLLAINILIFIFILFFKRVYYTNWKFFSIAVIISLFFYPLLLGLMTMKTTSKILIPSLESWIGGGFVTWCASFLLLSCLQKTNRLLTTMASRLEIKGRL